MDENYEERDDEKKEVQYLQDLLGVRPYAREEKRSMCARDGRAPARRAVARPRGVSSPEILIE